MSVRTLQVAVPRPLYQHFDYLPPPDWQGPLPAPGCRLRVPFGHSQLIGICVGTGEAADSSRLKAVTKVLDSAPLLPPALWSLLQFTAGYYQHPLGETLAAALPTWIRDGHSLAQLEPRVWVASAAADPSRLPATAQRQRGLLTLLLAHPQGLTQAVLSAQGYPPRQLRALADKGLAQEQAQGPATPPAGLAPAPESERPLPATDEQEKALAIISQGFGRFHPCLLQGVTGSGKTEVYLQAIARLRAQAPTRQALVLVPEIALTPQTLARFQARFPAVAGYHSGLTEKQRAQVWADCRAGRVQVLVGTRSAIFAPLPNLGLLVVDEEHDGSFKQQEGLRYSARDLAVKRAQLEQVPLLLGTATPALETLHNARQGRYQHLHLSRRSNQSAPPRLQILDIRGMQLRDGLAPPLEQAIRRHLQAGNQVLLFINRRGFAPSLICSACGWRAGCEHCDIPLTMHKSPPGLRCHHCDLRRPLPRQCPSCHADALLPLGLGTQRTEAGLTELLPEYPVIRIDRDSIRTTGQLDQQLGRILQGEPAILVGTQMLAKGHHFPKVTLVAVLNADAGLFSTDFRAPEHTAQLIVQVSGRAGRAEQPGEVWIQTYNPDSPLLQALATTGYEQFAETELAQRQAAGLPPFSHAALLRMEGPSPGAAEQGLQQLCRQLPAGIQVLGPAPASMPKKAGRYRAQTLLLCPHRQPLQQALATLVSAPATLPRSLRWHLDVDPFDLQ